MIYDFNNAIKSGRRYGGNAGAKIGVKLDDEFWLLKFPKNISGYRRVEISYMTSPLSEYIGSHVYESIGIPVHETLLGEYNGKIVVACKDFCQEPYERLDEYVSIKNDYVAGMEEKISSLSPSSEGKIDLNGIKIVMDSNELFINHPELKDRFWDMFVVDAFIGNNDRNNGNWGVIVNENTGESRPAPVYDNGASFSNKLSDNQMSKIMSDYGKFVESAYTNRICSFQDNGKNINPLKYIESRKDEDCNAAFLRIYPKIDIKEIRKIIDNIPEEHNGYRIMSDVQKDFYKKTLDYRYSQVFEKTYENLLMFGKSKNNSINITKKKEHGIEL